MPELKTAIYTLEIDGEKYKSLPIWTNLGSYKNEGNIVESAEILLAALGTPDEITKGNISSWKQGNYRALLAWVRKLDPEGTSQLYSINDPKQNPISWTIKSQIKGI
jgi:hypothetical protein